MVTFHPFLGKSYCQNKYLLSALPEKKTKTTKQKPKKPIADALVRHWECWALYSCSRSAKDWSVKARLYDFIQKTVRSSKRSAKAGCFLSGQPFVNPDGTPAIYNPPSGQQTMRSQMVGQSQQQPSSQQPQQVQQPQQQMASHLVTQVGVVAIGKREEALRDTKDDLKGRREGCS